MSPLSKRSWVGFAVVCLFSGGCGEPSAVSEAGDVLGTSTQALERCTDNLAFELHGIYRETGRFPAAMACADFNGDSHPDLAVAHPGSRAVSVLLNQGDETLAPEVTFPGGEGNAVVAQDFNADGWMDLAVENEADGTVSFLIGHGPGGFAPPVTLAAGELVVQAD